MSALVDMDLVVREAQAGRSWRIEYDSNGAPFKWAGKAINEAAADLKARAELADSHATFNRHTARLVACIEA